MKNILMRNVKQMDAIFFFLDLLFLWRAFYFKKSDFFIKKINAKPA
tara:strand:- start:230 stop:367 length:138 start_codon:yes stop_codon:yes gene_type:complete